MRQARRLKIPRAWRSPHPRRVIRDVMAAVREPSKRPSAVPASALSTNSQGLSIGETLRTSRVRSRPGSRAYTGVSVAPRRRAQARGGRSGVRRFASAARPGPQPGAASRGPPGRAAPISPASIRRAPAAGPQACPVAGACQPVVTGGLSAGTAIRGPRASRDQCAPGGHGRTVSGRVGRRADATGETPPCDSRLLAAAQACPRFQARPCGLGGLAPPGLGGASVLRPGRRNRPQRTGAGAWGRGQLTRRRVADAPRRRSPVCAPGGLGQDEPGRQSRERGGRCCWLWRGSTSLPSTVTRLRSSTAESLLARRTRMPVAITCPTVIVPSAQVTVWPAGAAAPGRPLRPTKRRAPAGSVSVIANVGGPSTGPWLVHAPSCR